MRITLLLCVAAFCGCGTPALIKDARQGSVEGIQRTLGRGKPKADLLAKALCVAATHGHTDAVSSLLKAGAHIEGRQTTILASLGGMGCYAISKGWTTHICSNNVSRPDGVGRGDVGIVPTPLGCAALYGRKETVEFLVSHGADLNPGARDGGTPPPIALAAIGGDARIVRILLDNGADPFLVRNNSRTAYDWAVKFRHTEVAALLKEEMERRRPGALASRGGGSSGLGLLSQVMNVAGAFVPGLSQASDLMNKVQTGASVVQAGQAVYQAARPAGAATAPAPVPVTAEPKLHEIAEGEDVDALRRLLTEGADVDERCALGATPLMHAAAGGKAELVKALLDAKAGVNARDARGVTALMTASLAGRSEAVSALLAAGADPNLKAKSGGSALSLAEAAGHKDIATLLMKAGARP